MSGDFGLKEFKGIEREMQQRTEVLMRVSKLTYAMLPYYWQSYNERQSMQ